MGVSAVDYVFGHNTINSYIQQVRSEKNETTEIESNSFPIMGYTYVLQEVNMK